MIRALLRLLGHPWFVPSPADLLRLSRARSEAREHAQTAKRRRHTQEAQTEHVRATAALLRAEIGRRA